ncbi:hypothetical protein VNO80_12072 [Phaseolus coccineus]|uniref:Uncharacterized protein n=1 Tax=Phaseolus coccineus TaxID=3886 RepID=A0AAN9NBQ3_PHACN
MGSATKICTDKTGTQKVGSPTEKACLLGLMDLGIDEVKQHCQLIHVETFNSEKKRSGILVTMTTQAFAQKSSNGQVNGNIEKLEESGQTLLGILGLQDHCRPEVESSARKLK